MSRHRRTKIAIRVFASALLMGACGGTKDASLKTKNDALVGDRGGTQLTRPAPATTVATSPRQDGDCTIHVEANVMTSCSNFIDGYWSLKFVDGKIVSISAPLMTHNLLAPEQTTLDITKWSSVANAERFIGGLLLTSGNYAFFDIPVGDSTPLCPYSFKAIVRPDFVNKPLSPPDVDGHIEVEKCDENIAREMWATTTTLPLSVVLPTIPPTTEPTVETTSDPTTTSIEPTTSMSTSTSSTSTSTSTTTSTTSSTTSTTTTLVPKQITTTTAAIAMPATAPKTCVLVRTGASLTICKKVSSTTYEWRAAGQPVGSPVSLAFGSGWTMLNGLNTMNLASRPIPKGATSLIIKVTFTDGSKLAKTEVGFSWLTSSIAVGFFE
ncbi:MAG: hypothetical protein RJB08_1316 [Actinomycetota bacterium]